MRTTKQRVGEGGAQYAHNPPGPRRKSFRASTRTDSISLAIVSSRRKWSPPTTSHWAVQAKAEERFLDSSADWHPQSWN
eukprot:6465839-Pyramimonas_sp.AAC.1